MEQPLQPAVFKRANFEWKRLQLWADISEYGHDPQPVAVQPVLRPEEDEKERSGGNAGAFGEGERVGAEDDATAEEGRVPSERCNPIDHQHQNLILFTINRNQYSFSKPLLSSLLNLSAFSSARNP